MQEEFHLTGNEDDASYIYCVKMNGYQFSKRIIVCHEEDHDIYEERFWFPSYYLGVRKHIQKVNNDNPTKEFVKEFKCDISNDVYHNVWNTIKSHPIKYCPTQLEKPNDTLKDLSAQLYDKYLVYYKEYNETV